MYLSLLYPNPLTDLSYLIQIYFIIQSDLLFLNYKVFIGFPNSSTYYKFILHVSISNETRSQTLYYKNISLYYYVVVYQQQIRSHDIPISDWHGSYMPI